MPQFKLRIDDDLHAAIKLSSENNNRSVNAEIAHHLRNAMVAAGLLTDDHAKAALARHIKMELRDTSIYGHALPSERDVMVRTEQLLEDVRALLEKNKKQDK